MSIEKESQMKAQKASMPLVWGVQDIKSPPSLVQLLPKPVVEYEDLYSIIFSALRSDSFQSGNCHRIQVGRVGGRAAALLETAK